jgi:hypothetical protein
LNVLDENFPLDQRQQLANWRIHVRGIGSNVGRFGMQDDEVIPLLHRLTRPTFFTHDQDFYKPVLRHRGYCLVWLDVGYSEMAPFMRRLLELRLFDTEAKRLGHVIRVTPEGLHFWRINSDSEDLVSWL